MPSPSSVGEHYGRAGLGEAILGGLRAAGKDVERLTPDDLAPVDQFHTRGKEATLELARVAAIARGARVLDVGGGLGGPARTLAVEIGCHVTVLDLTTEFCRVGEDLTKRTGLGGQVAFQHGDATAMPAADASFDVVFTQHSSMNVERKDLLYREIRRVLRPGGRLALHEIMGGGARPIHFPVPWAREPSISHLRSTEEIRALLSDLGFVEAAWEDQSASTLAWFRSRASAVQSGAPPPVGLHLILGSELGAMFTNIVRNLEEDRIRVVMAAWERP
jgi:SAM-dependent methyltransferase